MDTAANDLQGDAGRAVFRRDRGGKVAGAVVYLIAGPFFGALLAMIVGVLAYGLFAEVLHVNDEVIPVVAGMVVAALALAGGLVWAFRDYRRRGAAEFVVEAGA